MSKCLKIPLQVSNRQSQWPRGLRRGSAVVRLLRLRVRIPPGAWMSVYGECCVLSGRGLCVRPIIRPQQSNRVCVRACARARVCVSLSVIRCDSNPLHLQWVSRRGQTEK
jgi:hypothetical protein